MSEPIRATRLVYPGAPISGVAHIKAVSVERCPDDSAVEIIRVPNMKHYESGCRLHTDCFGHYCSTPSGIILPPQSMSMRDGEISTEYFKASRLAFEGKREEYIETLEKTNETKRGTLRSIMSTPVSGSARLIATPNWYRRNIVWISRSLASKIRVCYVDKDRDDVAHPVYKERTLQEDDWVMLVRPPPLNIWNTQPMKVGFWEHNCAGVHPETFSQFHGDFDGDELHAIVLLSEKSIEECEAWDVPVNEKFEQAREQYATDHADEWIDEDYWHRCHFMNTTTVSSSQMADAVTRVKYGNVSRNKDSNLLAMHRRFNDESTELDFVKQSIRGMKDVCNQQLSQGLIGDMTRGAKIAAMCFTRPSSGGLYVATAAGTKLLSDDGITDPGFPAVRAVMSLCEVAQQAALDSHRVKESDMPSHDLISSVLLGRPVLEPKGAKLPTLLVFGDSIAEDLIHSLKPKWRHATEGTVVLLCPPVRLDASTCSHLVGSYDPVVLSQLTGCSLTAQRLCLTALSVVCNYYSIKLTHTELTDLSYVMSFKVGASNVPITTRGGMSARRLAWVETLEATDPSAVRSTPGTWQQPCSSTSSMFIGNFSRLTTGHII